jgi:hypothetical protein
MMKNIIIFSLFIILCACSAGKTKQAVPPPDAPVKPFQVESVSSRTLERRAPLSQKRPVTLSEMPLILENGVIVIGKNLVLQLAQADEHFLSLYLSAVNPPDAKENLQFDMPTQIRIYAIGKHDEEIPLQAFTAQNPLKTLTEEEARGLSRLSTKIDVHRGALFMRSMTLAPGQASSGVLFLENKKTPKYKLTLTNEREVFEFILSAY